MVGAMVDPAHGTLDRTAESPLYRQLKRQLAAYAAGLSPHARLPSEWQLARRYGVSRGTVQQALREMVLDGVLYRVQGKGTFVAPPRILRSFSRLPSFSEDIRKRGLTPGVTHVRLSRVEPPQEVKIALRLGDAAEVWQVRRVRTADAMPVALVVSYLPVALLPELTEADVTGSLYEAIEAHLGSRPAWAEDTYRAESVTAEQARFLEIPVGAPILVTERVAYLPDDRPVEFNRSHIRGDRFTIQVQINHRTTAR